MSCNSIEEKEFGVAFKTKNVEKDVEDEESETDEHTALLTK